MRKFSLLTALLLLSSVCVFAQSGGDQTPPGGDMVGSTPRPSTTQLGQQSQDSEQNQRVTGTLGNTKGYSGDPAYAGSSDYVSRQVISTPGAEGQQGYTSATAGRRRAENQQSSPYDSSTNQPYLSGQFGQTKAAQRGGSQPQPNAKRQNGKRQRPPRP